MVVVSGGSGFACPVLTTPEHGSPKPTAQMETASPGFAGFSGVTVDPSTRVTAAWPGFGSKLVPSSKRVSIADDADGVANDGEVDDAVFTIEVPGSGAASSVVGPAPDGINGTSHGIWIVAAVSSITGTGYSHPKNQPPRTMVMRKRRRLCSKSTTASVAPSWASPPIRQSADTPTKSTHRRPCAAFRELSCRCTSCGPLRNT